MGGDIVLWMLTLLIVFILMGVHIGVSLAICSALGVYLMLGSFEAAVSILGNTAYEAVRKDGNTVFAAVTGVSIAAAAAFSRIAYPEMMKVGYKQTYALGAVAGSACLGMLIPPSVLLIVWAILTEMSVGALFVAGIVPGIMLALLFSGYVIFTAIRNPSVAPAFEEPLVALTPEELRSELIGGLGILFLIILVIGGIWTGQFTPTEAGLAR